MPWGELLVISVKLLVVGAFACIIFGLPAVITIGSLKVSVPGVKTTGASKDLLVLAFRVFCLFFSWQEKKKISKNR